MEEVFPVLAGIAVGLVTHLVGSIRLRAVLIGFFGLAFGACASWISGELAISWVYLVIDRPGSRRQCHDRDPAQGLATAPSCANCTIALGKTSQSSL